MLVIKIEMWPGGSFSRRREIGRMYIANTGEGTLDRGEYVAKVCRKGSHESDDPRHFEKGPFTRTGEVKDYPRKSYNVWRLVTRALKSCFPEEDSRLTFSVSEPPRRKPRAYIDPTSLVDED